MNTCEISIVFVAWPHSGLIYWICIIIWVYVVVHEIKQYLWMSQIFSLSFSKLAGSPASNFGLTIFQLANSDEACSMTSPLSFYNANRGSLFFSFQISRSSRHFLPIMKILPQSLTIACARNLIRDKSYAYLVREKHFE